MTCINCRKAELAEAKADMPAEVKGEQVLVPETQALVCPECDYKTVRGQYMQEFMRKAADVYRHKHDLLTSTQIRERRENLGHSQEQFSNYLGVGIASIKRWELGQVQDRAMDKLIRMCTDTADAEHNLRQVQRLLAPTSGFYLGTSSSHPWGRGSQESTNRWQLVRTPEKQGKRQVSAC